MLLQGDMAVSKLYDRVGPQVVKRSFDTVKGRKLVRSGSRGTHGSGVSGEAQAGFEATRRGLVPRPWVIDDLDPLLARLGRRPYRKAVLFVDNAGSDVVLGKLLPGSWPPFMESPPPSVRPTPC